MIGISLSEDQARIILENCIVELESHYLDLQVVSQAKHRLFLLSEPYSAFNAPPEIINSLQALALNIIEAQANDSTQSSHKTTCWLCGGSENPHTFTEIETNCETPGGKHCPTKKVKVHFGCYVDIDPWASSESDACKSE